MVVVSTDDRKNLWVEVFRSRFENQLRGIPGARPGTRRGDLVLGAAIAMFEEIIGVITRDLANPSSQLAVSLAVTGIDPDTLNLQIGASAQMANQASAKQLPALLRAAVSSLGAVAIGVISGVTSGVTSASMEAPSAGRPPAIMSFADLRDACAALDQVVGEVFAGAPTLSDRESEILKLAMNGLTNKAIAAELGVSENTVRNHMSRILAKFRVPNRMELYQVARELGMVE